MTDAWRDALDVFVLAMSEVRAEWMLVGSAAAAARGVALTPNDIDVLARSPHDVDEIATALAHHLPEGQSAPGSTDLETFSSSSTHAGLHAGDWTLGRWFIDGFKVEVAHIATDVPPDTLLETLGSAVWATRQSIPWQSGSLPVVPLEVQLATQLARDLRNHIEPTTAHLRRHGHDSLLLHRALRDRGIKVEAVAASLRQASAGT